MRDLTANVLILQKSLLKNETLPHRSRCRKWRYRK